MARMFRACLRAHLVPPACWLLLWRPPLLPLLLFQPVHEVKQVIQAARLQP
jgi:hypothetical protein